MFTGFVSTTVAAAGGDINLRHGGSGPPLLLLHGYPQTHVMWHAVAPALAERYQVVCPDLRGYGDSAKPVAASDHSTYSKRAMARDMVDVMDALGFETFAVAGHDRGGRVAHRLALDYPERVTALCVMDIIPTYHMILNTDRHFAAGYYHWFFLIQPDGLPERMIGADPAYYLKEKLRRWSAPGAAFDDTAVAEYVRCFSDPDTIHATCEDYRAAATVDLEHDRADRDRRVDCPLLVLWGARGFVHRHYDVLGVWREYARHVEGMPLDCGHFLPEEAPDGVARELDRFLHQDRDVSMPASPTDCAPGQEVSPVIKPFRPEDEFRIPEGCYVTEVSNSADDPGVSIARARLEPGATTRWHRLVGITERYVVLAGAGRVEVGERPPTEVAAGDVVVIPPLCPQRITNTGRDDLVFLAVCSPRFSEDAYQDIDHARDLLTR